MSSYPKVIPNLESEDMNAGVTKSATGLTGPIGGVCKHCPDKGALPTLDHTESVSPDEPKKERSYCLDVAGYGLLGVAPLRSGYLVRAPQLQQS